ncbi:MAG TPA: diguanylate cyclase [Kofleriaceae bacterium]|nr:diguanylate cyclase [Kofleriaceae bacterium]
MSYSGFALVLEPDRQAAAELAGLLFTEGIECAVVDSGEQAWQTLAARRPDLILMTLGAPALDRFHRRLRDEYLGVRPPLVGVGEGKLDQAVARLDLDAVVLKPLRSGELLSALLGAAAPAAAIAPAPGGESSAVRRLPVVSLDVDRMREMVKLTFLGSDLQVALDSLARRLALIFGLSGCVVLASAPERHWVGAAREPIAPEQWPAVWNRCVQAVHAGAPLFVEVARRARGGGPARPATRVETRLAVPIPSRGAAVVGAICLISDGPVLFGSDARDALSDLAARLGVELSWRSVHQRLASERDRLRETAMLDPMMGVLARTALEQAIASELSRRDHSGEPISLSVIDITGLRHLNHRYGHVAGDAALCHIANVTRRMVRGQDIVGRSGDDEIAVVFASTRLGPATAIMERIRRAIESEPFEAGGSGPLHVKVGVGVTEFLGGDDDGGLLVDRAARAANLAGRRGATVAVAERDAPELGRRNLLLDRYETGVTLGGMYQIVHEISRGSMGVVYRAEDLGLGRPVAIKMLRPDLVRDVELVRRFREEAAILASINHEHLVRVYSFVEEREDVFFVMELVEGVSLDHVIAELAQADRHLGLARASAILTQVASALDAMHRAGVMHRDVKPGNVVLDRTRERAVLVDVGLARRLGDRSEPAGTPGFIAPESVLSQAESPATDVYGLAATAYALLTGQAPFGRADDYRELLRRQLEDTPHAPSEWREDLPPAADAVVLRGLATDGDKRYPSAGELAQALADALGAGAVVGGVLPRDTEEQPFALGAADVLDGPTLGDSERGAALALDPVTAPLPSQGPIALTRGVVFRAVTGVLGLRAATTWIRSMERDNQVLADALSLRTAPTAWLPAERFHELLGAVAASGRHPQSFARELGSHVAEQSFQRFYPSSPESLSPGSTLSVLDLLWRHYHTWGALRIAQSEEHSALVAYEGPENPVVCAFIEGWLEQAVALSGGDGARVVHTCCTTLGDEACEFAARWGRPHREP